jgi:hypothetical protein
MAITAMIIAQIISGIVVDKIMVGIFFVFDLIVIGCLIMIMKNIKKEEVN